MDAGSQESHLGAWDRLAELFERQAEANLAQTENIDRMVATIDNFGNQLRAKPSRKETVGISLIVSLLTIIMVSLVLVFQIKTTSQIADCVSPNGQCAATQRAVGAQNRIIISLRGEQLRLQSEVAASQETGNAARAEALQTRLNEITKRIDDLESEPSPT